MMKTRSKNLNILCLRRRKNFLMLKMKFWSSALRRRPIIKPKRNNGCQGTRVAAKVAVKLLNLPGNETEVSLVPTQNQAILNHWRKLILKRKPVTDQILQKANRSQ